PPQAASIEAPAPSPASTRADRRLRSGAGGAIFMTIILTKEQGARNSATPATPLAVGTVTARAWLCWTSSLHTRHQETTVDKPPATMFGYRIAAAHKRGLAFPSDAVCADTRSARH